MNNWAFGSSIPRADRSILCLRNLKAQKGKTLKIGEKIEFCCVHADHVNSFRRVVPTSMLNGERKRYDVDKYGEMVLDAAETILGAFGFRRNDLGFQPKPRNLLEELRLDREQEILADLQSLNQL